MFAGLNIEKDNTKTKYKNKIRKQNTKTKYKNKIRKQIQNTNNIVLYKK